MKKVTKNMLEMCINIDYTHKRIYNLFVDSKITEYYLKIRDDLFIFDKERKLCLINSNQW